MILFLKISLLLIAINGRLILINAARILFEHFELLNDSYVEGLYNFTELRLSVNDHIKYELNLKIDLLFDVHKDIMFKVQEMPQNYYVCDFLDNHRKFFVGNGIFNCSNIPMPEKGHSCPLLKGTYWINYTYVPLNTETTSTGHKIDEYVVIDKRIDKVLMIFRIYNRIEA